jgi:hypothetical protein
LPFESLHGVPSQHPAEVPSDQSKQDVPPSQQRSSLPQQ